MIQKIEGNIGASLEKDALMKAKMSSTHIPIVFSSTPLQSWGRVQSKKHMKFNSTLAFVHKLKKKRT